jgi:hypothetical protein
MTATDNDQMIQTPYGKKRWSFLKRIMDTREELIQAVEDCLPDLKHYASTHGPGPDRRLEALRKALDKHIGA